MIPNSLSHRAPAAPARDPLRDEVRTLGDARYRALVAQSALFRGLAPSSLDDLVRRLQVRTRPAGALLVSQDEPGDAVFLIAEGRVRVALFGENGRELTLSTLGKGDFFGEMALIDGRPRSANVVAVDATTLLVLTREAFLDHLRQHPQTAMNLLAELARRLRRADETIANLALHDVHRRLVRTLERMAREDGEEMPEGLVVRRRPTQQELANMIGSCRETISRAFTSLIKRGLMVPKGRSLLLTRRLLAGEDVAA
jgi:CRP/FNR family cyclic AMP-dependent transcriptional regulator